MVIHDFNLNYGKMMEFVEKLCENASLSQNNVRGGILLTLTSRDKH
jgi:hypothetical protein